MLPRDEVIVGIGDELEGFAALVRSLGGGEACGVSQLDHAAELRFWGTYRHSLNTDLGAQKNQ
jgi:hypothetical protein